MALGASLLTLSVGAIPAMGTAAGAEGATWTVGTSSLSPDAASGSTCAVDPAPPEAMPVGDLPGWRQVFTDDFTTDVALGSFPGAVSAKWGRSYPDGWPDTTGNGTYFPSKVVSVSGGVMNLYLHTENGVHMVAAPVPTIPNPDGPRGGLRYGRFAIRFRADAIPGYKTAWLLWPDSRNFPHDGEIDFPEGSLNGIIKAYVHLEDAISSAHARVFPTTAMYSTWHTVVIEWAPNRIDFLLDGVPVGTVTEHVPSTPMHWVLQTESATGAPPPDDATSGNLQIDWVVAYARSDATTPVGPSVPMPITKGDATRVATLAARTLVAPRVNRLRAMGRVYVRVDAPAKGALCAKLTARQGTRTIVLARTRISLAQSGRKIVRVVLTPAARKLLKGRTARLRATLSVTFTTGIVDGTATRAVIFRARQRQVVR